jgi:hypothetical protein
MKHSRSQRNVRVGAMLFGAAALAFLPRGGTELHGTEPSSIRRQHRCSAQAVYLIPQFRAIA